MVLFSISIIGNTQVTAVCQDATVYLDNTGTFVIQDSDLDGGSTSANMPLTFSVMNPTFGCSQVTDTLAENSLIISAVYDGPLPGGKPKGVELYVINDISDLSTYGLGSANNGGGTDGQEFTFPADAVAAGTYIYVTNAAAQFMTWFGFATNYTSSSMAVNGDDAIELFHNATVIDVFGDINTDGSGETWDYLDGWAARNDLSTINNGVFDDANWTFSGINVLDGETDNATAASPILINTFTTPKTLGIETTLTVTDAMMNITTCIAQVIILDTLAPTVSCIGVTPTFDLDAITGLFVLTTTDLDNASVDNCSAVTLSITNPTYTCANQGLNSVTLYGEDIYGNIDSCTMDIMINASNVISIDNSTLTNTTCNGICDGGITVMASGVDTYSIDNGTTSQATANFMNLCANSYSLLVTSTDGCTDTTTVIITEPDTLSASFVVINELCHNNGTGEINMTVAGGDGSYTYNWNTVPVQTTEDLTNLPSGNYMVTITDGNNCIIIADTTLISPDTLSASFIVINEVCFKDSIGEIDMTVTGGDGTYTYNWNTVPAQTTKDLTNLPGGNYMATITDGNNCIITVDTMITTGIDIDLTYTVSENIITSNYVFGNFEWMDCADNSIIANEFNNTYTAPENGFYAAIISTLGCFDTTECIEITGVSIDENDNSIFEVYPNPSNGNITVNLNSLNNVISIIDINGKLVKTKLSNSLSTVIDLSDFENGIYFINIKTEKGVITKKVSLIK